MKLWVTNFSLKHPWVVAGLVLLMTVVFGAQFPKVNFDNDPENMLAEDEHVRVFHHEVKEKFGLYDFVIVGIVNKTDPDGVFNVGTLGRIHDLTGQLLHLRRTDNGLIEATTPAVGTRETTTRTLDLTPDSGWRRALNTAFQHDPNRLFDAEGNSAIIGRELISPSVVDNIKQAEFGSLKMEYLMEQPPVSRDEALVIRADAMANPLYAGTLVAEDEKAIAVYIPLEDKTFSHNVAALVEALTADWDGDDEIYITGLPVAEDTFGVEMLVQMSTSAPMAGLAIFMLLLVFFKKITLIMAPMLVAIVSVVSTMGLLIGLGYDVHIMSSMIAIFLMPIAVADAVHILSEFYDVCHRFDTKAEAVRHVIGHLFKPMLYTSLTTMAGFASLGLTPIPPVRVFGLHVAFGVGLAWFLTMTFIPAYIMLAVRGKTLAALMGKQATEAKATPSTLNRSLGRVGLFSYRHWKGTLGVTVLVLAVSAVGISKIVVNDNPVKWFTESHPIRVADAELNAHFGGTYTAYLTFAPGEIDTRGPRERANMMAVEARARFGNVLPEATEDFVALLKTAEQCFNNRYSSDLEACFGEVLSGAEAIDERLLTSWNALADEINYLDPQGLTHAALVTAVEGVAAAKDADRKVLLSELAGATELTGSALQDKALAICDAFTQYSFAEFLFEMKAELSAALFKRPEMLRYIESLQAYLITLPVVGKTSSAVDALKKASYELSFVAAPADADAKERADFDQRNRANFSVPNSVSAIAQVYTQLEGMKKKDSLFHLITRDYREVNLWVQLKSGDNRDMAAVVKAVEVYMAGNPPPAPVETGWAGLTYLNVVWQDKMVNGMLSSLASSALVVFLMMAVLFRSPLFGLLSMIPLTVTIAFIYGLIGWVGKNYDMPVAVLSAMTLGLSVDFAIHFLERAREERKRLGSWQDACKEMFKEPAVAISRNAITISVGFTPLLLAPLVPYKTVGFFLATIMAVSWLATLFILAALVTMLKKVLFKKEET